MKISIVLGTRPEIIKFSPIIRECARLNQDFFIIHTGQHYSYNMDGVFFKQLGVPSAKYELGVGSGTHAEQTGKMLIGIEKTLIEEKPDVVLVEGDTNTVLAGALAAAKLGIKVGHVEAGLRSYDTRMPEEINRILADRCSSFLFAPTSESMSILLCEGISRTKIWVTGNTIVDAVRQNLDIAGKKANKHDEPRMKAQSYFLATVHRQENVDNVGRFKSIIEGLEMVEHELKFPVIYPIHPRAKRRFKEFGLEAKNIKMITPLDYLSFLHLESKAKLILTDSGGVQEEACILGVPCVTLRYNTERPETIRAGSNVLAGTNPRAIVRSVMMMLNQKKRWKNPFGDGRSGRRILQILGRQMRAC